MKVLIIHGPNMNLLGSFSKDRLTLDKLNRSIQKFARSNNINVKIFQTHNEAKYVTFLQRNRNNMDALILNLGPFHLESHLIESTLSLIKLPYFIAEDKNQLKKYDNQSLFNKKYIIQNSDIQQSYLEAMERLLNL